MQPCLVVEVEGEEEEEEAERGHQAPPPTSLCSRAWSQVSIRSNYFTKCEKCSDRPFPASPISLTSCGCHMLHS